MPQKETHFAYVECTVCHAPDTEKHITLRFFDLVQNKSLKSDEILKALDTDFENFMALIDTNSNEILSVDELEKLALLLRQKGIRATFRGELVVKLTPNVHNVNRGEALGDCENCHLPTSPFFEEVNICLNKEDGTIHTYQVERKVLSTYLVNHFYALGGTRIRELDQIGLLLIAGGLGVVGLHQTVRLITIPTRRRRKKKEGGHHES